MTGLPKALRETVNLPAENLRGVCGIYCFINRTNGKCYVGSSTDIGRRLRYHLSAIRNGGIGCRMYKDARAIGIQNFDFEILDKCPKKNLLAQERIFIVLFNSVENGYNSKAKPAAFKEDYEVSEETRSKMRSYALNRTPQHLAKLAAWQITQRGQKKSPEQIEKSAAANRGRKHSRESVDRRAAMNRGKKRTPEQKARIALAATNPSAETLAKRAAKMFKRVVKLDSSGAEIESFPSLKHAALSNGLKTTAPISMCITGRRKTSCGFMWRYK